MAAVVETVSKLELELKELQKKRGDVEYRLRNLENKEKAHQGLLGKRTRVDHNAQQNKRPSRETWGADGKDEGRSTNRDDSRSNFNNRGSNDRERESNNRPTRLSSIVTGQRSNPRESHSSKTKEEPKKPKLTSAIVSSNPIPVVGEKPRPSLDTSSDETKKRSRKLFNVILGTLKSFKTEISNKSDAEQRREEVEQKVQLKVKEEQENFKEEQRRALQEMKDKHLALREEIRQQQEQKELELLNLKWDIHRSQLSAYLKTEARPPIYYKPAKDVPTVKSDEKQKTEEKQETAEKTED